MSREEFSQKIELLRRFHYALVPSYIDTLRVIANQPFFVKLFDDNFLFIDIIFAPFRLVTWRSWINIFAESHIKSKIMLLNKYYIFLLQKAPSTAKSSDVKWLTESISSLDKLNQTLNSWLSVKSIILAFLPIIIGFLLSIYKSSSIYSLLLGLNIGNAILTFTDVAQFGFVTMFLSLYTPFFGTFSHLYKESLFHKHNIKENEKRIFALFSKRLPFELSYNAIILSFVFLLNSFIVIRTYLLYGQSYLTPEYVQGFSTILSTFMILAVVNLKKDKAPQVQSIPFQSLEKGITLADFYHHIGIAKSLSAGYDLAARHEVAINGKVASSLSKEKVALEDLISGEITVTYQQKTIFIIPDIG